MNDLLYILIFLACCGATGGLILLCDRLGPLDTRSKP